MSIKKIIILIGLSVLFAGCSTGSYYGSNWMGTSADNSKMGQRYLFGQGAMQNDQKAFYYFSKAAKEDNAFAQNELAYMYAAGKGTPRDNGKAFYWYKKAAGHGLASAQYNLGILYYYGVGTAEDKTLAQKWFQKSAAHGFVPAKQRLARA
jgi:TPR repeat protein